jgi:hypothetical protein
VTDLADLTGYVATIPARWQFSKATTCHVQLAVRGPRQRPVVVVSEMAENEGLSVTNNAENVLAYVSRHFGARAVLIEHYGPDSYPGGRSGPDTFDLVTLDPTGHAQWGRLGSTLDEALEALRAPATLEAVPPVAELGGAVGRTASVACRQGQHDLCHDPGCLCRHHERLAGDSPPPDDSEGR